MFAEKGEPPRFLVPPPDLVYLDLRDETGEIVGVINCLPQAARRPARASRGFEVQNEIGVVRLLNEQIRNDRSRDFI